MLKKTIKFTNFEDEEVTKDFYFNLSKAELMEMELYSGGLEKKLTKLSEEEDATGMYEFFKELIKKAYGIKSEDGITFKKTEELSNNFVHSEAYSELLVELLQDESSASAFVLGILPKEYAQQAAKELPVK